MAKEPSAIEFEMRERGNMAGRDLNDAAAGRKGRGIDSGTRGTARFIRLVNMTCLFFQITGRVTDGAAYHAPVRP